MDNLTEFFKAFAISKLERYTFAGLLTGGLLLSSSGLGSGLSHENIDTLKLLVQQELEQFFQERHQELTLNETLFVKTGNLDRRLRLAKCAGNIETEIKQTNNNSSITVKTSCHSGARWTIYVPAIVETLQNVLVASRNLARGELLDKSDLSYQQVNTARLSGSYTDDLQHLIGKELKRAIRLNDIIKLNYVQAPDVIRKGETVVLRAKLPSLTVETEGTALSNGHVGEQIRVRNDNSRRIVDGLVSAPGVVIVAKH